MIPAHAGTTVADFLKWEQKAQTSFFQISISMLGTAATQVQPKMANCIDDWYLKDASLQTARHAEILKVMAQYTEYDPTAFILGYVESICGRINGK